MDSTLSSDQSPSEKTTPSPSRKEAKSKLPVEATARTFSFIGGENPHFLFSTLKGFGRLYITDNQASLAASDLAAYVAELIRQRAV